jgi:hypothetical protein
LWSVPSLQQIGTDFPTPKTGGSSFPAAAFVGTGASLSLVEDFSDGRAFEWPAALSAWQRHGCLVAGRNFTTTEWNVYVGGDRPYENVCPGY